MDALLQKLRDYTIALKEKGDFTWEEIEKLSDEPSSTLRKFCSGKTVNIHIDKLIKIISAMGGNLNDALTYEEQKEPEVNSVIVLKETYEQKIEALITSYEARIADIKASCEARIADIHKCCDLRVADTRQNYEERLNEHKKLLLKLNPDLVTML